MENIKIEFDKYSLLVNGERKLIKSGAMHYFRTIGPKEWRDRLSKMKAGGYNTVDLYFCWSFHCYRPDFCDFEDYKNIKELLTIANELEMFVIARPGPYINAETSAGGFPYWLLKNKDAVLRNRIDGDFVYSRPYMEALKSWYDVLLPIIKDFENIILVQIENEYSTNGGEDEYMQELYDLVRSHGISQPIFHNDAYIAGLYADVVDVYACDLYPYINPKTSWKENTYAFDTLDNLESIVRDFKEDSPLFVAEMQAGWFDKWLGAGYEAIRSDLNWQHINIMTKTALANGVTIFNHYMTVGGTNILDMASDEVYTSYDFASGISEFGEIRLNFRKAKEINYFLDSFNLAQTEPIEADFELLDNCFARIRKDILNNCEWRFLRNLNPECVEIDDTWVNPYDMKILPRHLALKGFKIVNSGLEIFTRLENENLETIFMLSDEKNSMEIVDKNGESRLISGDKVDFDELQIGDTKIIFISHKVANCAFKIPTGLVFNVDFAYADGRIALQKSGFVKIYNLENGFKDYCFDVKKDKEIVNLTDFQVNYTAQEIEKGYDYSDWKTVKHNDDFILEDSFQSDVYSEFVWYKAQISGDVKEISISARHIFAIYINGKELLNRNSYKYDNLVQVDEHIDIAVPDNLLCCLENDITVLVQNLGFDKGFANNINVPRGMIYFKTDTGELIDWHIKGRLNLEKRPIEQNQAPYLATLTKQFEIPEEYLYDKFFAPFMLDMGNSPFRRATIFLNGVKIGRFIRSNAAQDKFYLPPHFLKKKNLLEIVVWEKSQRINGVFDYEKYLKSVHLTVQNFKLFEIFDLPL